MELYPYNKIKLRETSYNFEAEEEDYAYDTFSPLEFYSQKVAELTLFLVT